MGRWNTKMNKKIICTIVCTLLITTAAVPITGYVLNNIMYKSGHDRGFVYVDDDQDPGWYDEFHHKQRLYPQWMHC